MCVTIEIGHQSANDPNIELAVTNSAMQQVDELFVKINYQQTGSMLNNVT